MRTFDCGCALDVDGGIPLNLCTEAQRLRADTPHGLAEQEFEQTPFVQHFIRQFDSENGAEVCH